MITIEHLTHIYPGTRKSPPRTAVADLSLQIRKGEFTILSGPNGSGKSTLFRILAGTALPSSGRIVIGGHDLLQSPALVRPLLGVVFQSPALDKYLTVAENMRIHAALYGIGTAEGIRRRDQALAWTDLQDRLDQKVDTLSGGLARQVELAKVLMTDPQVVLLDEPTTGLDPASRRTFISTLRRIQQDRGMTVLMTSHIFTEAEDVDRVAIMKEGHLLAYDTPAQLRSLIGTEMLVLHCTDAASVAAILRQDLNLNVNIYGDEVRLEETGNGDALPLAERILERCRPHILSLAIKRPDLEDVFVHVTKNAPLAA